MASVKRARRLGGKLLDPVGDQQPGVHAVPNLCGSAGESGTGRDRGEQQDQSESPKMK